MKIEKLNILKLNNNKKIIILEKLTHNNITYLYVDDVNEDESDTLDNYRIIQIDKNGIIKEVEDTETLTEIVPLFSKLLRDTYE